MGGCRGDEKLTDLNHLNEALPKVPRLKNDGSGYDWREFDRWVRQIQLLLGAYSDGDKTVNLFTGHGDNQALISAIGSISTATNTFDGSYLLGIIPTQRDISTKEATTEIEQAMAMIPASMTSGTHNESNDILTLYWVGV